MTSVTFLAPWAIPLGVAVAGALVVLHAITVGRPRPAWLPTARFAPDRAPRAERRLSRPADRWLLALRVAAALLAAVALARPVRQPERRRIARLVLADVSNASMRAAVRDSVRALVNPGDALVAFAATPRPALATAARATPTTADSLAVRTSVDSALAAAASAASANQELRPSLSAGLIAARRAAPALANSADSIELLVVSPFPRDGVDAATLAIRGTWAGRARLVAVDARPVAAATGRAPLVRPTVALRGAPGDDALAAALALAGVSQSDAAPVRLARAAPTTADRAWAAERGHVLVVWPANGGGRGAQLPQAIVVGARTAVGAFGRAPVDAPLASDAAAARTAPRVMARWADGAPAAVEALGSTGGCTRTIAPRVPQSGDAALRPDFLSLLPALLGPCGVARDSAPLATTDRARLAGAGPLLAAAALRAPASSQHADPLGATLLALSALLLIAEWPLRRLVRRSAFVTEGGAASDAVLSDAAFGTAASRASDDTNRAAA